MDALREEWAALIDLAEEVKTQLLSKQRVFFEREVDKQVKAFVVETIQFRNSFDTEGPLVPGLLPNEAVTRLGKWSPILCEMWALSSGAVSCLNRAIYVPVK